MVGSDPVDGVLLAKPRHLSVVTPSLTVFSSKAQILGQELLVYGGATSPWVDINSTYMTESLLVADVQQMGADFAVVGAFGGSDVYSRLDPTGGVVGLPGLQLNLQSWYLPGGAFPAVPSNGILLVIGS